MAEPPMSEAPVSAVDSKQQKAFAKTQGWSGAKITAQAVTINAPRADLYAFWRDFRRLPEFMENVDRIDVIDDQMTHWVVDAPMGKHVEWDSLIIEDRPNERIAWESAEGADIPNAGWVEFRDAPGGRGTEVRTMIAYEPPAGSIGTLVAKLTQREPAIQARRDLKRFKSIVECGEIATNGRPAKA